MLLNNAKTGGYAVAAYNINNLEWTRFILEASMDSRAPLILEVSEGAVKYMGGFKLVVDMVNDLIEELAIDIPVALHLDHGRSFLVCKKAIDAGFTSVMFDGSDLPLSQNIALTKEVVDYAHLQNVTVEAEVGQVGENNKIGKRAEVGDCDRFVRETGVDCLAPALGNVHGLYNSNIQIDLKAAREISKLTNVPLVLHGGSGVSDEEFLELVNNGIYKVNINTALQMVWAKAVREYLDSNADVYDPRKIIKSGEQAIKNEVIRINNLLGSINKA